MHQTIEQIMTDADMVAIRLIAQGTHQGPFMGVEATGKQITHGVFMVVKVKDGKIVEYRANADMPSLLEQLGSLRCPH